jgi:NAD(P)-dependent dehydrogenase (short-subunit alcohol dehydrogenase family)
MSASITLDGKVAIITGASRGIGESIARTFAAHGARVVLASRKMEGLAAVADSINAAHRSASASANANASETNDRRAIAVAAHTGKESDCDALVARAIAEFGKVDVLVNNAATNPYFGPLIDTDMGAWDKTFEVNAKGYFWMCRNVARHLRGRDAPGSLVNVASIAALVGSPMQGCYAMTKAAVVSMTKTFAVELAPSKIRVNAIAPGLVDTKLASAIVQNDVLVDMFKTRTPLGRYGQPDEIAGAALFLASDAAAFLTGHTLVVDGGMTIS